MSARTDDTRTNVGAGQFIAPGRRMHFLRAKDLVVLMPLTATSTRSREKPLRWRPQWPEPDWPQRCGGALRQPGLNISKDQLGSSVLGLSEVITTDRRGVQRSPPFEDCHGRDPTTTDTHQHRLEGLEAVRALSSPSGGA